MSGSKSSAPDAVQHDPVAMTVHTLPDPQTINRTSKGRWAALMVVLVCAMPVIGSYFTFYVVKPDGKAYGDLMRPAVDMPVASLHLTDLNGKAVPAESLKGQWLLTTVQDSACDKACEDQLYMQRQLREMLGKERDKMDKLWLIPDDQPLAPKLREAVEAAPAVTVLRVPRAELEAWLKPAQGQALRDHLYVIDPMGRWMLRTPLDPNPAKVKGDLYKLMKANAGWDKPGR